MTITRYFRPADQSTWHAFHEGETPALCGEAQLTYNVDSVADYIPYGDILHDACRRIVEPEAQPAPVAKAAKPKTTSTPRAAAPKTPKTPKTAKPKA